MILCNFQDHCKIRRGVVGGELGCGLTGSLASLWAERRYYGSLRGKSVHKLFRSVGISGAISFLESGEPPQISAMNEYEGKPYFEVKKNDPVDNPMSALCFPLMKTL